MGESHLLNHLFSEEKLASVDELNFQNNQKRIAQGYIAELEQEINANKTPIERGISRGIDIITKLEQKRREIDENIKERNNPLNHKNIYGEELDEILKEINYMKNDQKEIINMIHEIHEDIQKIKQTKISEKTLTILEQKRKEYINIANNYPPLS